MPAELGRCGADDRSARSAVRASRGSAGPRPRAGAPARPCRFAPAAARGPAAASRRAAGRRRSARRNSEWSSSRPSLKRTCSTPASLSAATTIVPSARCDACTLLEPSVDPNRRAEDALGRRGRSRRRGPARGETQGVRPLRAELGADHPPECRSTLRRCCAASRRASRSAAASASSGSSSSSRSPGRRRPWSTSASPTRRSATGSSDNFFEALYPWPERITAVGHTELDRSQPRFRS